MSELEVFKRASWAEPSNRFVFWSGGKDSTVALHLALRAWNSNPPKVVFIDTGITLPETLEFVSKLTEEWSLNLIVLKSEIDFWSYVETAGFPTVKALWCRRLLKLKPIKKFLSDHPGWKVQVLGIRKAESHVRRTSWYYDRAFMRHTKLPFTYNLLPILDWNDRQVGNYIKKHGIPVNPAYKLYEASGCYFCPFVRNKKHYLTLKARHPHLFQKIVDAERDQRRKPGWAFPEYSIKTLTSQTHFEEVKAVESAA